MLNRTQVVIVSVFVGALFALQSILRGDVAPGIVGGILAAIVVYMAVLRYQERKRAVLRRREREGAPPGPPP